MNYQNFPLVISLLAPAKHTHTHTLVKRDLKSTERFGALALLENTDGHGESGSVTNAHPAIVFVTELKFQSKGVL